MATALTEVIGLVKVPVQLKRLDGYLEKIRTKDTSAGKPFRFSHVTKETLENFKLQVHLYIR
jgi:hypothetical protein